MPVETQDALSELESEALIEVFNIGVGRSASALNKMVSQAVELRVPHVKPVENRQIIARLEANNVGRLAGMNDLLGKPTNVTHLTAMLQKWLVVE